MAVRHQPQLPALLIEEARGRPDGLSCGDLDDKRDDEQQLIESLHDASEADTIGAGAARSTPRADGPPCDNRHGDRSCCFTAPDPGDQLRGLGVDGR